ncbi:hypothetical protein [Patulibacter minatonensis]|uniref:hypothetical protein n=1 Tax=Patulibacter minatonensis TaxID=298163 RepID=UPI00047E9CB8|nr:hypothetical protein [Patulibacter minatonensis]
MRSAPTTTTEPPAAETPERLSLLAELRVLDAGLRESRVDWRSELREGLRCAFGLRRTVRRDAPVDAVQPRPAVAPTYAKPRTAAR